MASSTILHFILKFRKLAADIVCLSVRLVSSVAVLMPVVRYPVCPACVRMRQFCSDAR